MLWNFKIKLNWTELRISIPYGFKTTTSIYWANAWIILRKQLQSDGGKFSSISAHYIGWRSWWDVQWLGDKDVGGTNWIHKKWKLPQRNSMLLHLSNNAKKAFRFISLRSKNQFKINIKRWWQVPLMINDMENLMLVTALEPCCRGSHDFL